MDAGRRFVYANPVACEMLGYPLEQLRAATSWAASRLGITRSCWPGSLSSSAVRSVRRRPRSPAICATPTAPSARSSIPRSPSRLPGVPISWRSSTTSPVPGPLAEPRWRWRWPKQRHSWSGPEPLTRSWPVSLVRAVEGTRALTAGIVVVGEDHKLATAGGYGFPARIQSREAWTAASITLDDLPGGEVLLTGRSVVLPDARLQWETNPVIEGFAATLTGLDWQAGVYVPLSWGNRVFGVLGAYLPAGLAGPSEAELAFYTPRARRESWTRIIHSCSSSAVKHWIICARWQMLSTSDLYSDLGGDYFQRRDPERETQRPIRQLEALGPTPAEPTSTAEAVAAAWRLFPVSGSRTLDSRSALLPTFRIARRRL